MIPSSLEAALGAAAFVATTMLGIYVLYYGHRSWTNRLFAVLSLFIDAYIVVNYLSLHPPEQTPENQLFWIRVVMSTCSFIGPGLVLFAHTFPGEKMTLRARWYLPLIALCASSATLSLLPYVFTRIEYPDGMPMPVPGPGIIVFFADFVGLFIIAFVVLVERYRRETKAIERAKQRFLLVGVIVSFTIMGSTTVVSVVIFKTSAAVFMGPNASVILMAVIAYAIVKHQLFDVRLAATQALVGALWTILFARFFAADTTNERALDFVILLSTVTAGVLLLSSMRRELQQRERLESLTYELTLTNRKLAESNSELEQFAYVASHDLKEPLRMVTSFADLIRRRYSDKLGADGVEFIGFLVDATKRMQALLDALLDYSRIGTRGVRFVRTDCNALLEDVRRSLVVRFEEVGGNLTHDPLPEIVADPVQIGQLFQNLIENGLKFHGPEPPHLHVSAVRSDNEWVFTVSDNGIGINPVHYDRIFLIFKRLHAREEYPGTGIGLATCKKIVQRHGGRIWVESEVNKGSRFFFTIPCQLSEPSA